MEQSNENGTPVQVKVGTDVDGNDIMESVTMEELQNGYLRQSDYTKKTQEVAKEKAELESLRAEPGQDTDEEVETARKFLKSEGFQTKDEVEAQIAAATKTQQDKLEMERFFDANPELSDQRAAIEAIAKTDDAAIADIAVKYKFSTPDKLAKAKGRGLKGTPSFEEEKKQKSISEMSSAEYAEWKAKNITGGGDFR